MPPASQEEIPELVLDSVSQKPRSVRLVLSAPSFDEVKAAVESEDASVVVEVKITQPLHFDDATITDEGIVRVSGFVQFEYVKLEQIHTLTLERDGSFSFKGRHIEIIEWEYNYNAGTGREMTRTTYEVSVDANGTGSYRIIDKVVT